MIDGIQWDFMGFQRMSKQIDMIWVSKHAEKKRPGEWLHNADKAAACSPRVNCLRNAADLSVLVELNTYEIYKKD